MLDRYKIIIAILLPLATGLLLAFSFPFSLSGYELPNVAFLAWFAFIPLLYSIQSCKLSHVFQRSFVAGLIFSSVSLSWIYSVLHNNAGYPWWASLACLGFVVVIISLYIGLAFVSAVKINRWTRIPLYLLLPVAWIAYEYITNHFPLGGFPWINLGYSQQNYLYLIQSADVFGVLGISSLMVLINVLLFEIIKCFLNEKKKKALVFSSVVICVLLVNIGYGFYRVNTIDNSLARNSVSKANSINVSGIIGNIPQDQKWDPDYSSSIIQKYKRYSYEALSQNSDLLVWPETAIPYAISREVEAISSHIIPISNTPMIVGAMTVDPKDRVKQWNSALFIKNGVIEQRYDKTHLVPLGEYIPLEFPFIKKAIAAEVDTQSGSTFDPVRLGSHLLGVQICFEDIFPPLTRKWIKKGAEFIVNISNDAWYANSSGVQQHRAHSIFRAIENRVNFLRIANRGVSTFVLPTGKVVREALPHVDAEWFNLSIVPVKTFSLYSYWGDMPVRAAVIIFALILLVIICAEKLKNRNLLKITIFIFLFLLPSGVFAQSTPTLSGHGGGINNYTPYQYYSKGESVDLSNGSLLLDYIDVVVPGRGASNIPIRRTFGSTRSMHEKEIVIDPAILSGFKDAFYDAPQDDNSILPDHPYIFEEDINTNLVCAAIKWSPICMDSVCHWSNISSNEGGNIGVGEVTSSDFTCNFENAPYVEQFRYQEITENNLNWGITRVHPVDSCDQQESFFEPRYDVEYEKKLYALGTIKSNGDNLVWMPPDNQWIFSASKYVGAVVFRNIMPFARRGSMIVFLVRADGGYEAFDQFGKKIGYSDGNNAQMLHFFYNGEELERTLSAEHNYKSTRDRFLKPIIPSANVNIVPYSDSSDSEIDDEMKFIDLSYNESAWIDINSLVLSDVDGRTYTFKRLKKMTLYSQIMAENHVAIACPCPDGQVSRDCCERPFPMGYKCPDGQDLPNYVKNDGIFKRKLQIDNIPHWNISVFWIEEDKDENNHAITYDYTGMFSDRSSYPGYYGMKIQNEDNIVSITYPFGQPANANYITSNHYVQLELPNSKKWYYEHNGDGLIRRVVDPMGRETLYRYSVSETNIPLKRRWDLRDPDYFMEIRYPTGGVMRYETSAGYGALAHSEILTTEFPDENDTSIYYQKFITLERSVNEGTKTLVHKSDGTVYRYKYVHTDQLNELVKDSVPLLERRELNPYGSNPVTDEYEWELSHYNGHAVIRGVKNVISTENGVSNNMSYTYDSMGRVVSFTNKLGQTVSYTYETAEGITDSILQTRLKRLVKTALMKKTNPDGETDDILVTYNRTGTDLCAGLNVPGSVAPKKTQVNKITISLNGVSEEIVNEYCFDVDGNIVKETRIGDPDAKYSYTYGDGGRVVTISDSEGITTLAYDSITGNLLSITNPEGRSYNYNYNDLNEVTRIDYPSGSYITYDYLVKHNVISGNASSNAISVDVYDEAREQSRNVTKYIDGLDRLRKINRNGKETYYEYGANKLVESIEFPGDKKYSFGYDGLDRVVSISFPGGRKVDYDYNATNLDGKFAHKLDVKLNGTLHTSLFRDAMDRVVQSRRYPGGDISEVDTKYQFDEFNNLIEVESPMGLITKSSYDQHMRLRTRTYPNGDSVNIDPVSNSSNLLDTLILQDGTETTGINPISATFIYDSQNRVKEINYPPLGGLDINSYKIDYSNKYVESIVAGEAKTEFGYTPDGALSSITQNISETGLSDTIHYGDDGFGSTYWIGYPDGTQIYYIVDELGRVSQVRMGSESGKVIAALSYNNSGKLDEIDFGNGAANSYQYDSSGNVTVLQINKGDKIVNQISYQYDQWGNKTSATYLDGSKVEYSYDGTGQITQANYFRAGESEPFNTQTYSYDEDGNRKTYSDSYKNATYDYEKGLLKKLTIGSESEKTDKIYTYDIRGNLVDEVERKQGKETLHKAYQYDYQDNLREANISNITGANIKVEYDYDYSSRRSLKKVGGVPVRHYVYGKSVDPLMELNGKGEVERIFIYVGGRKIAAFENEQFKYYHLDDVANVLHMTDDKGNIVESLRYDPFGNVNFHVGLTNNRYQYGSKEYDKETGLIYYGSRYYDPDTGRFITRDPMEQGINHYIFAGNNPFMNEEYMGLGDVGNFFSKIGGFFAGVAVGVVTFFATGNPVAAIYAGISTTASIYGGMYTAGGGDVFMVGFSYGGNAPNINGGSGFNINVGTYAVQTGGAGGLSFNIDSNGDPWFSNTYFNGVLQGSARLGGGVRSSNNSDSAGARRDNNLSSINSGDAGGWQGSSSGNGAGGAGSGGGYGGNMFSIEAYLNSESDYNPVNTNPLNSPLDMPGYGDVFGGGSTTNVVANTAMPNVGLPVGSSEYSVSPICSANEPFYVSTSYDNTFYGQGSSPPASPVVNLPLGFNQQDDTPFAPVQEGMGSVSGDNTVGDPVMLYSGDLLQVETDLKIPGRGLDYEFKRTYRSRLDYDGPLGYGWDHNYNKRLVEVEVEGKEVVRRFDGDARYDDYIWEDNHYTAPPGCFDRLIKNGDGTYTIRDKNGTIFNYRTDGFISQIVDRNNNQLAFQYIIAAGETVLDSVTDALGRSVQYHYNGGGKLTYIEDFTGRSIRFSYDENNDLSSVHSPVVDGYPVGKITQYTYENHNLLTVTDPAGQTYLQNEYSSTDRVVKQYLGNKAFNFTYYRKREFTTCTPTADPALEVSRTTVTDRAGNVTELSFNCQGNPLKITEFTRGVRPGDPESFITAYTYNNNGLVTSVTLPAGNRNEYQYESKNTGDPTIDQLFASNRTEVTSLPDETRGGSPIITAYTYDPVYNQVRTIKEAESDDYKTTYYFDYQEGSDFAALALSLGVTTDVMQSLLSGIPMNQGDLNGDGETSEISGNVVRIDSPSIANGDGSTSVLSFRFQYNQFGQRTSQIDSAGVRTEYSYYGDGYLETVVKDAGGLAITNSYDYDDVGNITSFTDGNDNRYEFTVNDLNQVTEERFPMPFGYARQIHYDANNNISRIDEPNLDESGIVIDGNEVITTTFVFDILNRIVSRTQEVSEGKTVLTEYQYDANENLTRIIQPEGNSVSVTYDERDLPYQITSGYGSEDASTISIDYDGNKNRISVKDGRGKVTSYNYDGLDRLVKVTSPLGYTTDYAYDSIGDITNITRRGPPNGSSENHVVLQNITLVYDALHRLNSRQEAILDAGILFGNKTTQYKYDGVNLAQTIDALGNATNYTFDNLGRLTELQDALGNRLANTYDGNNNITSETSSEINAVSGETETFAKQISYDALNRPATLTDNLGHTKQFRYDSRNNLISSTDSKDMPGLDIGPNAGTGNLVTYRYDGLGRLNEQIQKITDNGSGSGTEIGNIITRYVWDDNSRLRSVIDAKNNTTEFSYDALNRRVKTELADGSIYTKSFDKSSNVVETVDPSGFAIESIYDDGDRLVRKNILLGGNPVGYETFGYDGLNRKTSAKTYNWPDALTSTVERAYDSLGNILRESQNELPVVNEYDLAGRRSKLMYPSGKVINFGRDSIGRIETINDAVLGNLAELTWSSLSQIGHRRYLNDVVTETNHDALKRVVRHISELAGGNIIAGFESGYDKAGNRLYDTFLHSEGNGNVYSYDSISRLLGATYSIPSPESHLTDPLSVSFGYSEAFSYDSVHNWLSRLEHLGSLDPAQTIQTNYTADNVNAYDNAVSTQDGATVADKAYVYDGNGNMLQDDKYVYTYDYRNYLTEVRDASTGELISVYTYDALGRRISKTTAGSTTTFIYDGINIIEERVGSSITSYTRGVNIDELVSIEKDGETYFYHTDISGNVVALTNSSGSIVERYTYTSFGKVQISDAGGDTLSQSSISNPYLYTGRRLDAETSLYYYRARTYNPDLGRFLQQDPLGFVDSLNQYAYVLNNPVNYIDPFGLSKMEGANNIGAGNPEQSSFLDDAIDWIGDYFRNNIEESNRRWERQSELSQKQLFGYITDQERKELNQIMFDEAFEWATGMAGAIKFVGKSSTVGAGVLSRIVNRVKNIIQRGGKSGSLDVALGLTQGGHRIPGTLRRFADAVDGKPWTDWVDSGLASHTDPTRFEGAFRSAMNKARTIHFNLDGISNIRNALTAGSRGFGYYNMTHAELYQISRNQQWLQKTIFYRNGKPVKIDFNIFK